jgi:photosystem II stability/assembly factor-like uncharacterized protein
LEAVPPQEQLRGEAAPLAPVVIAATTYDQKEVTMKTANTNHAVLKTITLLTVLCAFMISPAAKYATAQTGYAVGTSGTILKTTDGQNWTVLKKPPTGKVDLNGVSFVDAKHGWVVGDGGTILYTDDGGTTWTQQAQGNKFGDLQAVRFIDADHGSAVGKGGTILIATTNKQKQTVWTQSLNGKETWSQGKDLYGVTFLKDAKNGWTVGDGKTFLLTMDGGQKWMPPNAAPTLDGNYRSISVVDAKNWWVAGEKGIVGTITGGRNWIAQTLPQQGIKTYFRAIQAVDENNVWAAGSGGPGTSDVYVTRNAAKQAGMQKSGNWKADGPDLGAWNGLACTDANTCWVVGGGEFIYSTKGNGWVKGEIKTGKDPKVQLRKVVIIPGKNQGVKLNQSTSPDSGAAGVNYLSVAGYGFSDGSIAPANVAVELATDCQGAVSATTSAVSVVSGSGDGKLLSFLLPDGLPPGKYFVSISDSADGDATFESSNCSEVTVVQ